ncbi:DM13 domain-containing protein [Joostella sp. CR20]|uniref:DM13 domain-containing protein n=1 Tax=Joostella sp. CR20 TaxID=2804312 RepID=UPI00313B3E44
MSKRKRMMYFLLPPIGLMFFGITIYAFSPILYNNTVDEPVIDFTSIQKDDTVTLLANGTFKDFDNRHKGSGDFQIIKTSEGIFLQLTNFKATNGPNLKLWVSEYQNPTDSKVVKNTPYVSLGKLKGNIGNQSYKLPDDFNIESYHSVIVYCKLFRVMFTTAEINK